MSKLATLTRSAALAALLATGVAAARPADAGIILDVHDLWSSVVETSDGQIVCGVRTNMEGGGELRLVVRDDNVHLLARDPRWHVPASNVVHVSITVGGEVFNGEGRAVNGQTVMVPALSDDFMRKFVAGQRMVIDLGGVRWTVGLEGASVAARDMLGCVRRTTRYV